MAEGKERRQISKVAAVIITVGVGAVMFYLGLMLAGIGYIALADGNVLLGVLALALGAALLLVPVTILLSQVRAMLRRRD